MKRILALLLLLSACSGKKAGVPAGTASPASAGGEDVRSVPSLALRLPATGGALRAYTLPGLAVAAFPIGGRASPARTAIAMDESGRRLLFRDSTGAIESFDLVSYRERPVAPRGTVAAMATDGTLLAVSSDGTVIESEPWGSTPWPNPIGRGVREVFAALGPSLITIRHGRGDSLALASRDAGVTLTAAVPRSTALAASRDGDAVAFATDSGLEVIEESDAQNPWFIRLKGLPDAVAFSPSGHRIYVGLSARSQLAVVDRFQRKQRAPIPLPDPAARLRMDPWGRAILAQPDTKTGATDTGETWVISAATERLAGRVRTTWESDLPTVSEEGVLLLRQGGAVVARDVHSLDSLGAVRDAARDLWFVGRWKPATGAAAIRLARAADTAQPVRPLTALPARRAPQPERSAPPPAVARTAPPATAATAAAPTPQPSEATRFWVQVSVSQNAQWARDLASELQRGGHPARVVEPTRQGDGWRVVVGPYATRAAADSAARSLGRPYWITERGPEGAPRR